MQPVRCAALVEQVGGTRDCDLRKFDLATDSAALEFWSVLSARQDMGPTTVSKMMAAKRPYLVPIYDAYVARALLPEVHGRWQWWAPWQE